MPRSATVLLAAGLLLGGCSEEALGPLASSSPGIYVVETLTENPAGCATEGASVLGEDRDHLLIYGGTDPFGPWVRAFTCESAQACREQRSRMSANQGYVPGFFDRTFRSVEGSRLTAVAISTGFSSSGPTCMDGELATASLTDLGDGRIRLEDRATLVDHPKDGAGFCTTDGTRQAAQGKPCSRLRALEATLLEQL